MDYREYVERTQYSYDDAVKARELTFEVFYSLHHNTGQNALEYALRLVNGAAILLGLIFIRRTPASIASATYQIWHSGSNTDHFKQAINVGNRELQWLELWMKNRPQYDAVEMETVYHEYRLGSEWVRYPVNRGAITRVRKDGVWQGAS
ncbi:hypothetical protein [Paenibacillus lautus]|uniref:hypothetical protein n=1 Tax=Paenibacillus lautus TaxID=1401 RepID=UPI003D2DB1FD